MSAPHFASEKAGKVAGRYGISLVTLMERGEPQCRSGYTVEDVQEAAHGFRWRWDGQTRVKLPRHELFRDEAPPLPCIVFVPGVFDLLHAGHINLLWRAKQLAPDVVLVVGVVSDHGTGAYKGRFPAENSQLRMQRVERLAFVDVVEMQQTTDPTPLLERFRPHKLVHGDDWERLREGHDTLERLGIEFVRLPYTPGVSTTMLRAVAG